MKKLTIIFDEWLIWDNPKNIEYLQEFAGLGIDKLLVARV